MTGKYASVWGATEDTPEQAASMKMCSALMMAPVKVIEALEIAQDALVDLSTRARCQVQVRLLKKAA